MSILGVSVPINVSDVENLTSTAKWMLIIEKDASFQTLLDSSAVEKLDSCILITVKYLIN